MDLTNESKMLIFKGLSHLKSVQWGSNFSFLLTTVYIDTRKVAQTLVNTDKTGIYARW